MDLSHHTMHSSLTLWKETNPSTLTPCIEVIAVACQSHTNHMNTFCGRNLEYFVVPNIVGCKSTISRRLRLHLILKLRSQRVVVYIYIILISDVTCQTAPLQSLHFSPMIIAWNYECSLWCSQGSFHFNGILKH